MVCLGCNIPLGMTTGKIPDFAVTASSMYSVKHAPKYARLYSLHKGGYFSTWSPLRNRVGEWIQVDLGTVVMVTKIATQGRTRWPEWVTAYTLKYSVNGTKFEAYQKVGEFFMSSKKLMENKKDVFCIVKMKSFNLRNHTLFRLTNMHGWKSFVKFILLCVLSNTISAVKQTFLSKIEGDSRAS